MTHPHPYDGTRLESELRAMLEEDALAISHALVCEMCCSADVARAALALGGLTEDEWWAWMGAKLVRGE